MSAIKNTDLTETTVRGRIINNGALQLPLSHTIKDRA